MLEFFRQRAYCHLFLALAAGISIGCRWPLPAELLAGDAELIWLFLVALGLIWWLWRDSPSRAVYVPGFVALVLIGFVSTSLAFAIPLCSSLRTYAVTGDHAMTGRVASIPKYQRGHLRFLLEVSQLENSGQAMEVNGLCYVFVKCDDVLVVR